MLKRVIWLIFVVGVIILTLCVNVNAEEKTMIHYEPYSDWAFDTGEKYGLLFKEKPQREILRWEVLNIFADVSQSFKEEQSRNKSFNDLSEVPISVIPKIEKAAGIGYINGYEDNTFKPFNNITRAEFVAIMDRFGILGMSNNKNTVNFQDINNHWAKDYILKANSLGIVNGKNETMFCPDDSITLEEVLVILDRLVSNNQINKDDVISTFLNTFYAKVSICDKSDEYVAKVIYKDINTVQNDMFIYGSTLIGYDYTDIGTRLRLEDVLTWRHYYDTYKINRYSCRTYPKTDEEKRTEFKWDNFSREEGEKVYFHQNGEFDFDRPVTLLEFLEPYSNRDFYFLEKEFTPVTVNFSNFSSFTDKEKEIIRKTVGVGILPDSTYEFPGHQYMTKAILNYITMKANRINNCIVFSDYTINDPYYVDEDRANWPSNYADFPYIYRPWENYVYEFPYINDYDGKITTPKTIYPKVKSSFSDTLYILRRYFNCILNVDYRTADVKNMARQMADLFFYTTPGEQLQQYVKYVKENEIILKGYGEPCFPIVYYNNTTGFYKIRVKLEFEIVNSKTNKDILFADLSDGPYLRDGTGFMNSEIVYHDNKYVLYVDFPLILRNRLYTNTSYCIKQLVPHMVEGSITVNMW
ncbi:MAG: S-layer homology domain-containing protein [Clostridia bacterium]|nr:S-layer homology domain-containing protein [Clostridia bacterium]